MSVNFDMDDKKTKRELERMEKERLKMEKEQEKMMKEQEKSEPVHKRREHKKKDPMSLEKEIKFKKTVKTIIAVLVILLATILIKNFVVNYATASIEKGEGSGTIKFPDITQYSEDSAVTKLESLGFKASIVYEYDAYSTIGTVIRCNHNPGDTLQPETVITVYICDDAQPITSYDYSFTKTQQAPFNLDNLDVVAFEVVDDTFILTVQNNNNCIISAITYTIGYADATQSKIGQRIYYQPIDEKIMPGEKYTLTQSINQPGTKYLSVINFDCEATAAPATER